LFCFVLFEVLKNQGGLFKVKESEFGTCSQQL